MRKVMLSQHSTTWTVPAPAPSPQGAAVLTEPGPCPWDTATPHASPDTGIKRSCSRLRAAQQSQAQPGEQPALRLLGGACTHSPLPPCSPTPGQEPLGELVSTPGHEQQGPGLLDQPSPAAPPPPVLGGGRVFGWDLPFEQPNIKTGACYPVFGGENQACQL